MVLFLAEFLIERYEVHGIIRRSSSFNTGRIEHICILMNGCAICVQTAHHQPSLRRYDWLQFTGSDHSNRETGRNTQPAAQSQSELWCTWSLQPKPMPLGTLRLLERKNSQIRKKYPRIYPGIHLRTVRAGWEITAKKHRFIRAVRMVWRNFYGWWIIKKPSPRVIQHGTPLTAYTNRHETNEGVNLQPEKITQQWHAFTGNAGKNCIWATSIRCARLGYARDYVECMWMILQHPVPEDFGDCHWRMHTAMRILYLCFFAQAELNQVGRNRRDERVLMWLPKGIGRNWSKVPSSGSGTIAGDPTKARTLLGWNPTKTSFRTNPDYGGTWYEVCEEDWR